MEVFVILMQLENVLNGGNPILSAQSSFQRVFWQQIGVYLSNQCDPFIHVSFRAAKNYRERMKIDKKWICGGETLPKEHWTCWICFKIQIKLQPQNLVQLNFNQSTSRVERLFTSVRQMRSIKLGWGNELHFHQFQMRPPGVVIVVVDSFCMSLVSGTHHN